MKKIIHFAVVLVVSMTLLQACTPDDDFSIGALPDRTQQLSGTWNLQSVTQVDLSAKGDNFTDPSRPTVDLIQQDVTAAAPFTDISVTFNQTAGVASGFNINYGNAPQVFELSSGTWSFDNAATPRIINLVNGVDTFKTTIGAINSLDNKKLVLQKFRYEGDVATTQYNYLFIKN